jgi:type IV secretory pathway VirB6-like protein
MSDQWEVKKVEKSGDGFWINIAPIVQTGGSGEAHVFNIIVLGFGFMELFGVVGFWSWVWCALLAGVLSAVFHYVCLIISFVILGFFIFT